MKKVFVLLVVFFSVYHVLAFQPSTCTVGAGFGCSEYKTTSGSSEFTLRNNMGTDIQEVTITVSGTVPFILGTPDSKYSWNEPRCEGDSCSISSDSVMMTGTDIGHFFVYMCEPIDSGAFLEMEINFTSNGVKHSSQARLFQRVENVGYLVDCSKENLTLAKPPLFFKGKIIRKYGQWASVSFFILLAVLLFIGLWRLKHKIWCCSWKMGFYAGMIFLLTMSLIKILTSNPWNLPARMAVIPLLIETLGWFLAFAAIYAACCYAWKYKTGRIIVVVLSIILIFFWFLLFFGVL
ncbi:MAG: hypothetical protein ABIJ21_03650 [Nanoarchaeota archaeon]